MTPPTMARSERYNAGVPSCYAHADTSWTPFQPQMVILDGVSTLEQNGPRFHRVSAPDAQTLARLLNRLIRRILRRLMRDGLLVEDPAQP